MAAEADPLYRDPRLADFYDLENSWGADQAFCLALAGTARSVLDLGCGTGRLAAEIARRPGVAVTGVDPAGAMLAIAAARPSGARVRWTEADARGLRLGDRFDLIVLTGHAFQVFLTAADRQAVVEATAAHLAPGGQFVFDSRNPAAREWEEWQPGASERALRHPQLGPVTAWNDAAQDPETGIVTYGTHYRLERSGEVLSARSAIAFPDRDEIAGALAAAGLRAERWLGDWAGAPWHAGAPEIIPVGRLA
jgi:SAM-dependent methyltransferase